MYEFEIVQQLRTGLRDRLLTQVHGLEFDDTWTEESMLQALVSKLHSTKSHRDAWQVLQVATGQLPSYGQVHELHVLSCIALDPDELIRSVFEHMVVARGLTGLAPETKVISDKNVVLFESSHLLSLNSGIQQVSRMIAKLFALNPSFVLLAVTPDGSGFTEMTEEEKDHLLQESFTSPDEDLIPNSSPSINVLLSNCRMLIPEVTKSIEFASRLRAMGAFSGNEIFYVGYDLIPILAPEFVAPIEIESFAHYLLATTESSGIICISDQTKKEFSAYFNARKTVAEYEGMLVALPLPVVPFQEAPDDFEPKEFKKLVKGSYILCVGTIEPRKNQRKIVTAFNEFWAKGGKNQIVFVGRIASQSENHFQAEIQQKLGESVFHFVDLTQDLLSWLYKNSLASIQVSDYEGYGLPVVESIAHGRPVIVNPYGVQFELAQGNGGLAVEDNSVSALLNTLEKVSIDVELRENLESEAKNAKFPSINDYANGIVRVLNKES